MVNRTLIDLDLKHIWHPCSQMKDFENNPPFIVNKAQGSYLYTDKGPLIDANSSWWCKSLGHQHPEIIKAIKKQLNSFEHVIGANSTHPVIVNLAQKLAEITQLQHAFFASDGSCAVEIALKLALHANIIKGKPHKKKFLALQNGYHGETLATLAVSDLGIYKAPYKDTGIPCHFLDSIPYVTGTHDLNWKNADEQWQQCLPHLEKIADETCALIYEPILQGAGHMKIYSADFLQRLTNWAKINDLIADEIMTGCGRTGKWLAGHFIKTKPDMICLSKGLTSGTIPFSCAMIDHDIYQLFYNDYESGISFLHSHTYSGYAVGAAAALATLEAMKKEQIFEKVENLSKTMKQAFAYVVENCNVLSNVRQIGAMIAADIQMPQHFRAGYQIYLEALKRGAFLRPLGNTIYWLPPLNTDHHTISNLAEITLNSIQAVLSNRANVRETITS